jgi:hypothetical protein
MKKFLTRLREIISNAFAVEKTEKDFDQEDIAFLERIARLIVRRGLAQPAILFLESVRPLNFLGSQLLRFSNPFVEIICSRLELERLAGILENRKSISIMIEMIEKEQSCKKS